MKRLPLHGKHGQGRFTLLDDDKYDWANNWSWRALKANGGLYAYRSGNNGKYVYLHRALKSVRGQITDHINGDTLDNRVENLRSCSHGESQQNRMKDRTSRKGKTPPSSQYKGVYRSSLRALKYKWVAHIHYDGTGHHLGCFATEKEAAMAYDSEARKHFGEYARLNFPGPGERSALR